MSISCPSKKRVEIYTYNKFLTALTQGLSHLRRKENSKIKKVLVKEEKTNRRILHLKENTLRRRVFLSGGEVVLVLVCVCRGRLFAKSCKFLYSLCVLVFY